MGRQRSWTRKCLYLYTAGLMAFLISGCSTIEVIKNRHVANKYLVRSQMLLAAGDYEQAIDENERILSLIKKGHPRDEALFNIALIYAHHGNPQKDVGKALIFFEKVIEEQPRGELHEQAKIWMGVLGDIEKAEMELHEKDKVLTSNIRLLRSQKLLLDGDFKSALQENERVLKMSEKINFHDHALFNIGLIYAHHENPDKDYKKSIQYFTKLINEYPDSSLVTQAKIWENVLTVIEKAKQVDIEIEEKKKELRQ